MKPNPGALHEEHPSACLAPAPDGLSGEAVGNQPGRVGHADGDDEEIAGG
jgi:hypothetical protein